MPRDEMPVPAEPARPRLPDHHDSDRLSRLALAHGSGRRTARPKPKRPDPERRLGSDAKIVELAGMNADGASLLKQNQLFRGLDPDDLKEMASLAVMRSYQRNQQIFDKGDPGNGLYLIVVGRVGIRTVSAAGKEIFLNILETGDVVGEIALLDGKERTARAVAMEPAQLLFVSRERFIPFLEARPKLCLRLLSVVCSRLRWVSAIIEDTVFRDVRSRLAKRLLIMADIYGVPSPAGIKIGVKISQEDFGRMLDSTRESINKELVALKKSGAISYSRGYITVHRVAILKRMVSTEETSARDMDSPD